MDVDNRNSFGKILTANRYVDSTSGDKFMEAGWWRRGVPKKSLSNQETDTSCSKVKASIITPNMAGKENMCAKTSSKAALQGNRAPMCLKQPYYDEALA